MTFESTKITLPRFTGRTVSAGRVEVVQDARGYIHDDELHNLPYRPHALQFLSSTLASDWPMSSPPPPVMAPRNISLAFVNVPANLRHGTKA